MRTIKTSSGADIVLDGDLLSIMETLYHEVTVQRALDRSFEDMVREINHLIAQMTIEELRSYLAESLFLNTVKYENDKLEAYMRKLEKARSDVRKFSVAARAGSGGGGGVVSAPLRFSSAGFSGGCGTPAGAHTPFHPMASTPGRPASAIVAISGAAGRRFALVMASALSLPLAICGPRMLK